MDDIENQLRQLGDAVEANVAPVRAADITGKHVDAATSATDLGISTTPQRTSPRGPRRRSSKILIASAAAVVAIVAGGSILLTDRTPEPTVEVASRTQTADVISAPPGDNGWAELRFCESTGQYDIDTGNTFYGAYQFTRHSFDEGAEALGFDEFVGTNPAHAPPPIQDAVANALYQEYGADLWPICGRYIDGPMITPVVPQWLASSDDVGQVLVFLEPAISADRIAEIEEEIATLLLPDPEASSIFYDQDAAFLEFEAMFLAAEGVGGAVGPADMPSRFELTTSLPVSEAQLRAIDGVFEVLSAVDTPDYQRGPLRISIPSIGLNAPIRLSPMVDALDQGPVALVNQPDVLAVAAFGSFPDSAFEHLDELSDGDTVVVSTAVIANRNVFEIVRTYGVSAASGPAAPLDVEDLLLWRRPLGQGPRLILVSDVKGQPNQRLVVRADPVENLDGYVIDDS